MYKKQLLPTKNFISSTAFVSFFPQLVAGPIERATNLLPQILSKRKFEYDEAVNGLKQILWGLFKKVVIADNCATYANCIFDNSSDLSGGTLLIGSIFLRSRYMAIFPNIRILQFEPHDFLGLS